MAIDANSLTLADYAQMSNDPRIAAVVYSLHRTGSVLQDIPFATKPTLKMNGVRFTNGNLAATNWRKLNEEPVVAKSTPEQFSESVYILSNNIDTDTKLLQDENQIEDPRSTQFNAWLEGAVYDVNDKWINNNHVTGDVDAPIGLRHRLDNPGDWGVDSGMKIDAGGATVDLSQGGMTAATANNFIEVVQQMFDEMGNPDGDGVILYMNELLKRRFERAVRLLGAGAGWDMTRDAFDRAVTRYKGATIRVTGRKADGTTQIITNTETSAGADGASTFTSMYAARFGEGYAKGWQMNPLVVNDLGVLNNGVIYRINLDWAAGTMFSNTRSMGRLYDIKVS
jgi:hypothetical protein